VHGCIDELRELLARLPLTTNSTIVMLGDYIDRGSGSREVIDLLLELRQRRNLVTLRGNHERMLSEFLEGDPLLSARFVMNGGSATLEAYADGAGGYHFPPEHLAFFESLRTSYETPSYFFVHAGVPDTELAALDQEAHAEHMAWVRKSFLVSRFRWEKLIVHGHTRVRQVEIAPNRINLDTGCVYGGALTAMHFPSHQIYSVERRSMPERTVLRDRRGSKRAAVRFRGAIPVEVDAGGTTVAFETVDYSEIGLGLRPCDPRNGLELGIGDLVSGRIGTAGLFQIPFQGKVVRFARAGGAEIIGLEVVTHEPDEEPTAARAAAPTMKPTT